jgi:pyruvate dehydrogenase E1 component alpha subunit
LLEFKTYRFTGHSRSDARGYRSSDEEREWESRDPLTVLAPALSDLERDRLEADVKAELDDAVEFARSSPFPEPDDAFTDVYA